MLVFFATLILLATLLHLWETQARLCKFCHPFFQSFWHFLPVQVFSGEMTPAILQSSSTMLGLGLLRATERVSREVTTALPLGKAVISCKYVSSHSALSGRWTKPFSIVLQTE